MDRLTGERIVLREFRQEDISGIRSWVNDADTVRCMGGSLFMGCQNMTDFSFISI